MMTMNAWERQQVFRAMVTHQLRGGSLSVWRRRQLVRFAAGLGINAVLAGRLVTEARKDLEQEQTGGGPALALVAMDSAGDGRGRWTLSIVLAVVLIVGAAGALLFAR